jgi:anti-anti-sigma factor
MPTATFRTMWPSQYSDMREAKQPDMDTKSLLDIKNVDNQVTITATGALDLHNVKPFHEALAEAATSADSVVVDFREVYYIDTAVLAYLCTAANKMIARGKRLKLLLKDNTHPRRTIQITGFSAVLDDVVDDAGADE